MTTIYDPAIHTRPSRPAVIEKYRGWKIYHRDISGKNCEGYNFCIAPTPTHLNDWDEKERELTKKRYCKTFIAWTDKVKNNLGDLNTFLPVYITKDMVLSIESAKHDIDKIVNAQNAGEK